MINGDHILVKFMIGVCLISLVGCDSQKMNPQQIPKVLAVSDPEVDNQAQSQDDSASNMTDHSAEKEPAESETRENDQADGKNTPEDIFRVPTLPDTGSKLMDFVPEGWTLWDSVELDFNEDKIPDYVGVLDTTLPDTEDEIMTDYMIPRILFAIASDKTGQYHLDFQDINLIRTRYEGGVFGDPYEPLTAEGTSFTTHAFGGSAWKWSEADTYTYDEGVWYRTGSESTYGYGPFVTAYEKNDWERGVGIRKKRSEDFDAMEKYWDSEGSWEDDGFDVEYELSLDEPLTLYQAGRRWWLAPKRVTDWTVDSVGFSEDVELSESQVMPPSEAYLTCDCNEDCVLYTFQDSSLSYLAMYRFQDKGVTVLARSDTAIDDVNLYKGKIYYSTEIVEEIAYRKTQDGQEQTVKEKDTVGICLNRMDPDGSGKEIIFEYLYPGSEQEILESPLPYLALSYEISGDEIIAEMYIGNEHHPVYRMNSDGSGLIWIGQIPSES